MIECRITDTTMHAYEVRPRNDHRGVDLISDALPLSRLRYAEPDAITNVIETHEHAGSSKHRDRTRIPTPHAASSCECR